MSKSLFIPMSIEEFNSQIETLVKEAVKNSMSVDHKAQYELVTTDELMNVIKSSKMAIHNWRKEGWLPFYKLGGKVLFNLDEVMEAIKKRNNRKSDKYKRA